MILGLAKRNLSRHKFRAILVIVGVIIGVMAISSMGVLGGGIRATVVGLFEGVADQISVSPAHGAGERSITESQLRQIRRIDGIKHAIPLISGGSIVRTGGSTHATVYGMHVRDMPNLLEIEEGRLPRSGSDEFVAGKAIARRLKLRVGGLATIEDRSFRAVGIHKEKGFGAGPHSPDEAVFLPLDTYMRLYGLPPTPEYSLVIVRAQRLEDVEGIQEDIEKTLNRRENRVSVTAMKAMIEEFERGMQVIHLFLLGIGGISLVVAGVFILTIMLMSVTERRREIGVMRAIGASRGEVLRMFLYEALILGCAGSVIGGGLGFGGGLAFGLLLGEGIPVSHLFTPPSILGAAMGVAFGILVALLSGIYPAWKASRLSPMEALRYE